jgi:hypothetical protein
MPAAPDLPPDNPPWSGAATTAKATRNVELPKRRIGQLKDWQARGIAFTVIDVETDQDITEVLLA